MLPAEAPFARIISDTFLNNNNHLINLVASVHFIFLRTNLRLALTGRADVKKTYGPERQSLSGQAA